MFLHFCTMVILMLRFALQSQVTGLINKSYCIGTTGVHACHCGRHPETKEPGHTAFSHLAVNPIEKAYLYIDALSKLDKARNHRIFHQAIHDEVGRSTNLHISRIISNDEDKLSRINQFCTIGGAVSFPPNETIEDTINEIAEAVRKVSESDPWLSQNPPKLTWLSGVTGGEVDMSSPFYKAVSASVREITLKEPYVNPMHT